MRRSGMLACIAFSFVACFSTGAQAAGSGIAGLVVEGPTCSVERPGVPQCRPRPVSVSVSIQRSGSNRRPTVVRSNSAGRFRVVLVPGTYVVTGLAPQGAPLPRPPSPLTVHVHSGHFAHVVLTYDSGIRVAGGA